MVENTLSFDILHPQPLMIIISGPSGIGKDSVLKSLMKRDLQLHFVITATSRPPRSMETPGVDYFFYSKEEFENLVSRGEFIEHSLVYDEYKGIPKSQIRQAMDSNQDVIMRLDVQGAAKVKTLFPEAVRIFLIPDNTEEWYQRLLSRNTETEETLKLRIETAKVELDQLDIFDYAVINAEDRLEDTVDTILSIITAEHHRLNHRKITL